MVVLGVDIGGTKVTVGLVHRTSGLQKLETKTIDAQIADPFAVFKEVTDLLDVLVAGVEGIGVGVPSILDKDGVVYEVANIPSWKKFHLKELLEKKYKLPVFMNNDANCFTLGEAQFGVGRGCRNMVGVTVGTGLGAGVIINKKLYSGRTYGAGEIGEILFSGEKMEDYCSGKFFTRMGVTGEEVSHLATEGNLEEQKKALEILDKFGSYLGIALSFAVHAYDPELIVLGGSVTKSWAFFSKAMLASLKENSYNRTFSGLQIQRSELAHAGVLGAAALYFNRNT